MAGHLHTLAFLGAAGAVESAIDEMCEVFVDKAATWGQRIANIEPSEADIHESLAWAALWAERDAEQAMEIEAETAWLQDAGYADLMEDGTGC